MEDASELIALLDRQLAACEANPEPGGDVSVDHLAWMCRTAASNVGTHPSDKLWRWAGFVQGCLSAKGLAPGPAAPPVTGDLGSEALLVAHRTLYGRYLEICEAIDGPGELGPTMGALCTAGLALAGKVPVDALSLGLGYVQGRLSHAGHITVRGERDFSRPYFHAAYAENGRVPETLERVAEA